MLIHYLSDIHLENRGYEHTLAFTEALKTHRGIVILAGDFIPLYSKYNLSILDKILSNKSLSLVYVTGNHEYYGSSLSEIHNNLFTLTERHKNFIWLNNGVHEIEGIKFAGGTLWYPDSADAHINTFHLNDFREIKGWNVDKAISENRNTTDFLSLIEEVDIIVTHHCPSAYCLRETSFRNNKLNCYFVNSNEIENLILDKKPKYWIHGHTHCEVNCELYSTKILCNPFGNYWKINRNILSHSFEV